MYCLFETFQKVKKKTKRKVLDVVNKIEYSSCCYVNSSGYVGMDS